MSFVSQEEIEAYRKDIDRKRFMPGSEEMAEIDAPFPIGYGQTISQPSLVVYMTAALRIQRGISRILEIGTGSGYQTALLAAFAAKVYTIERVEPLLDATRHRLEELGIENVIFRSGDGIEGWPEEAPFDRIIVTASAGVMPKALLDQLQIGGIMILPLGNRLIRIVKTDEESYDEEDLMGVRFVPFVGTQE